MQQSIKKILDKYNIIEKETGDAVEDNSMEKELLAIINAQFIVQTQEYMMFIAAVLKLSGGQKAIRLETINSLPKYSNVSKKIDKERNLAIYTLNKTQ